MSCMTVSNDAPIEQPVDDRFALDPFAASLAKTLSDMAAPEGVVVAISGPWGSGKSSAINLIRHHLKSVMEAGDVQWVPFNPWWFAGADALTLSFFQELDKAIGPSLPSQLRKSIALMGQGVSAVGAVAGAIASLGSAPLGDLLAKGADLLGRASANRETVDQAHRKIAEALRKQNKRFIVVIDDIDRLNPDDALTIFRLVKSVGRLPNVIYLLAFDRQIAERIVAERFPSEGPGYLEKIVQRFFELPPPLVDTLRQQVVEAAVNIMGSPEERQVTRFWNVFHDVAAPFIRTPRDVVRLTNHVATGWPAVAGNVDRADFLAISSLELAEPDLYARIRSNPERLCGLRERDQGQRGDIAQDYDELLGLHVRPERERQRLRVAMRRLFPRLDAVWGNLWQNGDTWRRDRLVASAENFRSYFAFAVSDDVAPADTINAIVARAGDEAFVEDELRAALGNQRRNGSTQAGLLLEELLFFAGDIDEAQVSPLVTTLFRLADELDVDNDRGKGFMAMANNQLRIHWLLNRLVHDRFDQARRDEIYRQAFETASLEWATDFAERCLRYYATAEDEGRSLDEPPVSQPVADDFRDLALAKLRAAAADGSLATHGKLVVALFAWNRLNGEDDAEIRAWTDATLDSDPFVVALAKQIPSESWSFGMGLDEMGDRVSRRTLRVNLEPFADILDVPRLEARIEELAVRDDLLAEDRAVLTAFRDTPKGTHRREE